jgi:multiple sugar transport system ATP-binding protein
MSTKMPSLALEKICKAYPSGVTALDSIDLQIADGELVVLVGPSGCGKTTALRLIAGLDSPTSGSIRIGQRLITHEPPSARHVALVFQRPALYPHRTVRDNLGFGLALRQRDSWLRRFFSATCRQQANQRHQRETATAKLLGLENVLERYPAQLSGGQQQRVALGRALVSSAEVLLLDEPLSNLDANLRQELRRELHLLQKQMHATMIYVTHDPLEALSLGDRVAVLNNGRLQQVDRPENLYANPVNRFVAGFVGWPAMNFVDGELQHTRDGAIAFAACPGKLPVPPGLADTWTWYLHRPLTLGIRPEDVHLDTTAGWPMQVRLVEPLGRGQLLTLAAGNCEIAALLSGDCQSRNLWDTMVAGKNVMVHLQLERGFLFDRMSGLALTGRPAG